MSIGSFILAFIEQYAGFGQRLFDAYILFSRPLLDVFHAFFDALFYGLLGVAVVLSVIYGVMSLYSIFARKGKEPAFIEERAPKVTVQIPTFNELAALRCAQACLAFDYPKEKVQIIIGDDSDNLEISARIADFAKENSLLVTRRGSNEGYKAGNLNSMLARSTGDILVIFDSDFVPEPDFLRRIVAPFIHSASVSAVQARWKFLDSNRNVVTVLGSTIVSVFHHICLPFLHGHSKISFLCGSAEAVRKSDVLALGEWESGSLTEDIEYSLRLFKAGKRILYLDTLECAGEVPHTTKDLYKQQMRWAYGVIASFQKHAKELYGSARVTFKDKFYISFFCTGYFLSFLLLSLFVTGTLSFFTDKPAPIDLVKFISHMGVNTLLTSGIILASFVALYKVKNLRKTFVMIGASFSVGLMVTYYVNVGILKVLFGQKMPWFMLNKDGNKL
ncbi:MAG: glycosyltransferase [Nanoarchaeota archaeon]|nr:glycosyltransferase [Nanoarchaeota archaeon]